MKKRISLVVSIIILAILCCCCSKNEPVTDNPAGSQSTTVDDLTHQSSDPDTAQTAGDQGSTAEPISYVPGMSGTASGRMGNTPSNIIDGGYFVSDGQFVYYIDITEEIKSIYRIDEKGDSSVFRNTCYPFAKYLNVYDTYLYFMVGYGTSDSIDPRNDLTIVRVPLGGTSDGYETVAENVADYGTGFYIRDGIMYYNEAKSNSEDSSVTVAVVQKDLKTLEHLNTAYHQILVALSENAIFFVDGNSLLCCEYEQNGVTGTYCFGYSYIPEEIYGFYGNFGIMLPRTTDGHWGFTVDGEKVYVCTDNSSENDDARMRLYRLSPGEHNETVATMIADLGSRGYSCASGLFIQNGSVACSVCKTADLFTCNTVPSVMDTLYYEENCVFTEDGVMTITAGISADLYGNSSSQEHAVMNLCQTMQFNSNDVIRLKNSYYEFDSRDGDSLCQTWDNVFSGKTVREEFYFDGRFRQRIEDEYDFAGKKTRSTTYTDFADSNEYSVSQYDEFGREIAWTNYSSYGESGYTYTYDEAGNQHKASYQYESIIYEYDLDDNKKKVTYLNSDGSVNYRYEIERDDAHNTEKETYFNDDGAVRSWRIKERIENGHYKETRYTSDGRLYYSCESTDDGYVIFDGKETYKSAGSYNDKETYNVSEEKDDGSKIIKRVYHVKSYLYGNNTTADAPTLINYEVTCDGDSGYASDFSFIDDSGIKRVSDTRGPVSAKGSGSCSTEICELNEADLNIDIDTPKDISAYTSEYFDKLADEIGAYLMTMDTETFGITGSTDLIRINSGNYACFEYAAISATDNNGAPAARTIGIGIVCRDGITTRYVVGEEGAHAEVRVNDNEDNNNGHGHFECRKIKTGNRETYAITYGYIIYFDDVSCTDTSGYYNFIIDEQGVRLCIDSEWGCYTQGGGYEEFRIIDNHGHLIYDHNEVSDIDEHYFSDDERYEVEITHYMDSDTGFEDAVEILIDGYTFFHDQMHYSS